MIRRSYQSSQPLHHTACVYWTDIVCWNTSTRHHHTLTHTHINILTDIPIIPQKKTSKNFLHFFFLKCLLFKTERQKAMAYAVKASWSWQSMSLSFCSNTSVMKTSFIEWKHLYPPKVLSTLNTLFILWLTWKSFKHNCCKELGDSQLLWKLNRLIGWNDVRLIPAIRSLKVAFLKLTIIMHWVLLM